MRRKKEAGQALVLAAVGLVALIGFTGLGIDMGAMRYQKRLQQTAVDAAAIAGATNLTYGGVQTGAQNASAGNGFTDNTGGGACATPPTNLALTSVTVTVCNPPSTGPHIGNANYVEAFVSVGQPTYFMRIFGINTKTITARAVATNYSGGGGAGGTNTGCLFTLGPPSSSIEGVNINGSAVLNAPTCGIIDNGNYNTKGNALTVNAGTFGVSGSANQSGPGGSVTCSSGQSACPAYGVPASSNPLASLPAPPVQSPNYGNVPTKGTTVLNPGTYTSLDFGKNSTTTLNPGIYYINGSGGLTFEGKATITGNGVMFYLTNGATINAVGGGNAPDINISAPTSGPYQGMLFYQDPADTNPPSLGGDNNSTFNGILYFPSVQLTFFGNNVTYATGIVVADAIALSGNPTVNLQGAAGLPGGGLPPSFTIGTAFLVE
jgi:hypothetical protein